MKLHIGPGSNWKSFDDWKTIDIDPQRGDIVVNFNTNFKKFPIESNSVEAIYASHVFEHMSIYVTPIVFKECYRILKPGGWIRIITPNPVISMKEYLNRNQEFLLFKRRKERNPDYTLFECLREDFLSKNGQPGLLKTELAHQNAWDSETLKKDLLRAGFQENYIFESNFKESKTNHFNFEGSYPCEANESYRSLYMEAQK
jgi:predicted SAM-dependent methyltransferase